MGSLNQSHFGIVPGQRLANLSLIMVEIQISYEGQLHCEAIHVPSNKSLQTDAPVDNNGRGESFSPTDLVATAFGSCMATVMGIMADRKNIDLSGLRIVVRKIMSTDTPRRIARLETDLLMPIPSHHKEAPLLMSAAHGCPVHQSLHPAIECELNWIWTDSTV